MDLSPSEEFMGLIEILVLPNIEKVNTQSFIIKLKAISFAFKGKTLLFPFFVHSSLKHFYCFYTFLLRDIRTERKANSRRTELPSDGLLCRCPPHLKARLWLKPGAVIAIQVSHMYDSNSVTRVITNASQGLH